MKRLLLPLVVTLAFGLASFPSAAAEPVAHCGRVSAFVVPSGQASGSIVVGTRTFAIAAGAQRTGPYRDPVTVGSNYCVFATLDGGQISSYEVGPLGTQRCGQVLAFRAATPSTAGEVVLLARNVGARAVFGIPPGADVPADTTVGSTYCFIVSVGTSGDAIATVRHALGWATAPSAQPLPSTATEAPPASWSVAAGVAVLATLLVLLDRRRARSQLGQRRRS